MPATPLIPASAIPQSADTGPAAAPQSDALTDQANVSRVTRALSAAVNQHGGAVTLRLSPPEMGIIRVEMQIDQATVRAQLIAEHESARSLLTQQLGELRRALHSQGLIVDRLEVQTMSSSPPHSASDRGDAQQDADGRSRGQFARGGQGSRQDHPDGFGRDEGRTRNFDRQLLDAIG